MICSLWIGDLQDMIRGNLQDLCNIEKQIF